MASTKQHPYLTYDFWKNNTYWRSDLYGNQKLYEKTYKSIMDSFKVKEDLISNKYKNSK